MNRQPLVSVIMGVHNTKKEYLHAALESIISQTYYRIEFIIVDDASDEWCSTFLTDYCEEHKKKYNDYRITVLRNENNKGLTASLNIALRKAAGDYIARMDSDDISAPDRIERQVIYLEEHDDIDVLACGSYLFDGTGTAKFAGIYRKFEQERMKIRLSFANIEYTHPTVMFRRAFLEKNNLWYDEQIKKAQDYNMWVRCIEKGKLDSLQEVLFVSRIHDDRIGNRNEKEQRKFADVTKIMCLQKLLPYSTERQKYLYVHMRDVEMVGSAEENIELIRSLIKANEERRIYEPRIYREEVFFWWLRKALYKVNRHEGIKILENSYMIKNIFGVICPQIYRYVMDKLYSIKTKRIWYKKVMTEN